VERGWREQNPQNEKEHPEGLLFTNLVTLIAHMGHPTPEGYRALWEELTAVCHGAGRHALRDLLLLTADHGCDPTTPSTDHSASMFPYWPSSLRGRQGVNLGFAAV